MGVDDCDAYPDIATGSFSSRTGLDWDHLPERIHAHALALATYEMRHVYVVEAPCPLNRRLAHCRRTAAE